jgi:mono/diheme cytochrome c family protein
VEALRRLSLLMALFAAAAAQGRDRLYAGDRTHAKALYELHCAACHGAGAPTAVGASLGAPSLRDPSLLAARTDEQMLEAILKGKPAAGSPALGRWLSILDAADLVALLRAPLLAVEDVFEDAAAYTGRRYPIAGSQLSRAEALAGGAPLSEEERSVTVFSVYGGKVPALGPRLVHPEDHVGLDELPPRQKLGYLIFGALPAGKGKAIVGLALSPTFTVLRVVGTKGPSELRALSAAAVGKGGREPGKRRPFVSKADPEQAAALTRLYARAVEGAALAAREEADRHLFDPPEPAKAASKPADPD